MKNNYIVAFFLLVFPLTEIFADGKCYSDYIDLANQSYEKKGYKPAIAFYEKAYKCSISKKQKIVSLAGLVTTENNIGHTESAKKHLNDILILSPQNKWALNYKNKLFMAQKLLRNNHYIFKSKNVAVIKRDGSPQILYINNLPTKISNDYIRVFQIIPSLKNIDRLYLIESNAGGSGTFPIYYFLSVFFGNKYKISESIDSGGVLDFRSNSEEVTIKMDAIYHHFEGNLMKPITTYIFKNGSVQKK